MADAVTPAFRSGMRAAEEAAKRKTFSRATFFGLEDEESAILRFLTEEHPRCGHVLDDGSICREPMWLNEGSGIDECNTHGEDTGDVILGWITVMMHNNIPTRDEPEGYEGNWPKAFPAVCRHEKAFDGMFDDCYICDVMVNPKAKSKGKYHPQARMWALACVREEVREGRKVVGYQDKMRKVTKTVNGKEQEVEEPEIVMLNFAWNNFFKHLRGTVSHYGTCLDRDYGVTRRGDGLDTEYDFVAFDPINEVVTYDDGSEEEQRFDLRDSYFESFYDTDIVLTDEITRRASDEFYDLFFDERHEQPYTKPEGDGKGKSKRPKSEKVDREADPDRLRALADRLKSYPEDGKAEAATDEPDDEETEDDDQTEDETEAEETKAPAAAKRPAPRKATAPTAKKTASGNGATKTAAKRPAPAKKAARR